MRLPSYLVRRPSGLFHFRLKVPIAHREHFGKIIKRSLRTHDPIKAQAWALALADRYAFAFRTGEQGMAGNTPPSVDEILDRLNKGAGPKFDYIQNPDGTIEVRNINGAKDAETAIAFLKAVGAVNAINEALAERDKVQAKPVTKRGLTLKEALATYTVAEAGTVKEWDARLRALNSFIGKIGADTRVADVSRPLAAEWANGLMLNGMQKKTASGYVSHCAQLFKFLIQQGHLETNPVKGVVVVTAREKKMHKRQGRGWEPLEETDLRRIFDPANFARTETQHARWGMLLMLYSGARVGEVAQIHLRDFEMRDGTPPLENPHG